MGRESEKMFKELQRFLELHTDEISDKDDMNRLTNQFLSEYGMQDQDDTAPETADDYLELAEQARSDKKCIEYLRKALELEPDNVDAQLQLIILTHKDKEDEQLAELQSLKEAAAKPLEQEGFFRDDIGSFWTLWETRPYMRVCHTYFETLISCGMMRRAIDEGRRLLELCENDNLGVRYQLMHLYAYMEDELQALALHRKYDSYEETQMLLPLAVLYYKMNQFEKAENYIKRLAAVNKDTKKFLRAATTNRLEEHIFNMSPYGYQPFSIEELIEELMSCGYLFGSAPYFFQWAYKCLRSSSATGKKK